MVWIKNLVKRILPNSKTTSKFGEKTKQRLGGMIAFDRMMRQVVGNLTNTNNPKGKVGKLETIWTPMRNFAEGNRKWVFMKFEKKPFDNAEGFIKALEKRGFNRLGSGAFSTVLGKDGSDRVIKVIRRPDGWINYIHWAAQIGEAGHFAPKVFSYKKIKGRKKEFGVAIMERLKYTLEETPRDHALKVLPAVLWKAENPMAQKFMEILSPGLYAFLEKMSKWNGTLIHNFDFHDGNLMLRENGELVIVDPVSRGEEGFTRLREGDFGPPTVLKILHLTGFYIENCIRYRSEWIRKPRHYLAYCL
jgi:hypothetical protein